MIKPLTKKQQKKAESAIRILRELSADGVITVLASTPDSTLCFLRTDQRVIEHHEFKEIEMARKWYVPDQTGVNYGSVAI